MLRIAVALVFHRMQMRLPGGPGDGACATMRPRVGGRIRDAGDETLDLFVCLLLQLQAIIPILGDREDQK